MLVVEEPVSWLFLSPMKLWSRLSLLMEILKFEKKCKRCCRVKQIRLCPYKHG